MAGRKFICDDCGHTAWRPSVGPCPSCKSKMFRGTDVKYQGKKQCAVCGASYDPKHCAQLTCGKKCGREREKQRAKELRSQIFGKAKCRYCGEEFQKHAERHVVCGKSECQRERARDNARNSSKRETISEFDLPQSTHVCAGYPGHKCEVRTADRRCPKCRAMWRYLNGVDGNTYAAALFSGGHVNAAHVVW